MSPSSFPSPGHPGVLRHPAPRAAWWLRAAAMLAVVALSVVVGPRSALAAFTPPPLHGHVVDTAGKLSSDEILTLDRKLENVRTQSGYEIVAYLIGSLNGASIDDVAYDAFHAWGIGRSGKDNGILLVIAPVERRSRIETGMGVGGELTDLQTNDILRQVVKPLAAQGRFRDALDDGTAAIARTLVGGATGTPAAASGSASPAHGTSNDWDGANDDRPTATAGPAAGGDGAAASPLRTFGMLGIGALVLILAVVSPGFRRILFFALLFGRRGGGGGGGGGGFGGGGSGGSGYTGGGGRSGGGGSSEGF